MFDSPVEVKAKFMKITVIFVFFSDFTDIEISTRGSLWAGISLFHGLFHLAVNKTPAPNTVICLLFSIGRHLAGVFFHPHQSPRSTRPSDAGI